MEAEEWSVHVEAPLGISGGGVRGIFGGVSFARLPRLPCVFWLLLWGNQDVFCTVVVEVVCCEVMLGIKELLETRHGAACILVNSLEKLSIDTF